MTSLDRVDILGYRVLRSDAASCVDEIVEWIRTGNACRWLACLNPHSYVMSRRGSDFFAALQDADWLIPDGFGIVLASRWLNGGIRDRVTGSDIFQGVHERLDRLGGYSVFFLGSTEETLDRIRARMAMDFPRVRVAGWYSPPFKTTFSSEDTDRMISAVNDAAPDVLLVGMTAPKQELWIHNNRHRLNVKFVGAIGAVFDFYTGQVKRADPVFQNLGLEWLPRLLQQPGRLWRRMFVSAPIFLLDVARARLVKAHKSAQ